MNSNAFLGLVAVQLRLVLAIATVAGTCVSQVRPSPKTERPATTVTRLITLGTAGGPLPTKDRAQSSNLLIVNGTSYLVDAGDNVTRRIVQSGSDFRQVGKGFI